MFRSRLLWLIFVAVAVGAIIVQKPPTLLNVLQLVLSAFLLVFGPIAFYIGVARLIAWDVSHQAKTRKVSTPRMWAIMFQRAALYVLLPAFIIFCLLMLGIVAYTLLGGENKYF